MHKNICQICNLIIEHNNKTWSCKKLINHIRKKHLLTKESYIVNYIYNNNKPKCLCGCGQYTKLAKGLKYNKYLSKHKILNTSESLKKRRESIKKSLKNKNGSLYNIDLEIIKKQWNNYLNNISSLTDISKELKIDRRTFKRLVLYNNFTTKEQFNLLAKKSQKDISANKRLFHNTHKDLLEKAKEIIEFNYNNNTIINYTDLNIELGTNYSAYSWKHKLKEIYSEELLSKINNGLSSKEELDLLFVLRYYFGETKVVSNIKIENVFYDYCINNQLLIEYDGEYWHLNKKEQDLYKDKLAISLGYKIYRISRLTRKDINHILNIKELLSVNISSNNTN